MKKAYIFGFIAGLALLIAVGVTGYQLQQKNPEDQNYQAELLDASPVQLNAVTEKQRIHSKLYTHYHQLRNYQTISETVAQAKGRTNVVEFRVFLGLGPAHIDPDTPEHYFSELARESNAVIRGRVANKVSQITEDGIFVYTDYDITVMEIIKNNADAPLNSGETINVTYPGGKVVLDGIVVKVSDDTFAPLPKNNHEVVLYLQYIPETASYKLTRPTGSFELEDSVLRPLTKERFPPGVLQDKDTFLRTTRAVSKE